MDQPDMVANPTRGELITLHYITAGTFSQLEHYTSRVNAVEQTTH